MVCTISGNPHRGETDEKSSDYWRKAARGICDRFLCMDVLKKEASLIEACKEADLILPAMENDAVINTLLKLKKEYDFPMAFEHLEVFHGIIRERGEHMMGDVEPLELRYGFCGAKEVLTNYAPNKPHWVGTFITVAQSEEELQARRKEVRQFIALL